MSNLPNATIADLAHDALLAAAAGDQQTAVDRVERLLAEGDGDDWWLFTVALVSVVASPLPKPCCEETVVSFGIARVDEDGTVDTDELLGGVTPEMEAEYPALVAYMRMLTAELRADNDTSLAVWRAALTNDLAAEVMNLAFRGAVGTLRAGEQAAS